jgi:hypothetical protein
LRLVIGCCGLGDTSAWWRAYATNTEVYVWRAKLQADHPSTPEDALTILAAVMKTHGAGLDARGVCVYATEGGGYGIDVVQTVRNFAIRTQLTGWSAEDVALGVMSDGPVRAAMPKIQIADPEWLQLTGPPQAVDFWRAHEILWDYALGGGGGGPTQAFADVRGVYKSPSDDGSSAQAWKPGKLSLGPSGTSQGDKSNIAVWVAGIGLVALGVYLLTKEQRT